MVVRRGKREVLSKKTSGLTHSQPFILSTWFLHFRMCAEEGDEEERVKERWRKKTMPN